MKKAIKYLCTLEGLLVYIIFSNYYQLKNFSFTFFECIKSYQSLTKTYLNYCAPELYIDEFEFGIFKFIKRGILLNILLQIMFILESGNVVS